MQLGLGNIQVYFTKVNCIDIFMPPFTYTQKKGYILLFCIKKLIPSMNLNELVIPNQQKKNMLIHNYKTYVCMNQT